MLDPFHSSKGRAIFALLFACHIYFFQIYPHFISPNELSRLLLTSAIVDDRTLTIDRAIQRYGNTQDKATFNGHYYSDKAIGTSLAGIPALLLMRIIEGIAGIEFSTKSAIFWVRTITVTMPSLFFLKLLTRYWLRLKPEARYVPHFLFLHLFGTIAFTYSSQFVSHYLLGITLFCSTVFLSEYKMNPLKPAQYAFFAGLFAAMSILLEFPAAVPVALICVFSVIVIRNFSHLAYFATPLLVSAVLILGYNYLIFGTPWDVTYRHMTDSFHTTKHAEGLVGMGLPKLEALHGLLFSRHHGLFFISPFLLLSIPGFYRMSRSPSWSFSANLWMAIVAVVILTYSAFSFWIAGWNFGPRYITPVVPFLSTAAFYFGNDFLEKGFFHRTIVASIGIWSVLCVSIGTITFPFPPEHLLDPIFFLNIPLLLSGATGKHFAGNEWIFFTLLVATFLVMTLPAGEIRWNARIFKHSAATAILVLLLFGVAFFSRSEPTAIDYYSRGSVYLYLGEYGHSYAEMQRALAANPDSNSRARIEQRIGELHRLVKAMQGNPAM